MTDPMEVERILTAIEADPEADAFTPFDVGGLATSLYIELLESWDYIPEKPRAVMAFVGATLKRQYYRELQAEIEAKHLAERLSGRRE